MAEIKSTIDLVMEKTKHLTLSAEEKVEVQLQDFLKKAPGLVKRVLDGALAPEQLMDEITTQPQELVDRVRREVARQLSQALDLSEKSNPMILALEMLAEPGWSGLLAEVKRCRSEYQEARGGSQKQARDRILTRLAAAGIRGSAVVAKLEGDESFEAEDRRRRGPCEERLADLREALSTDE